MAFTVKRGMVFEHGQWITTDGSGAPVLAVVTRVTKGAIYYRQYENGQAVGAKWWAYPERFLNHVVKAVVTPEKK